MSADVEQCRQCHLRVGHGRKCGGSRWNRFAICFRSKVISTSGFHFRFRGRHEFPMLANVGPFRQCHICVGHGRKCGGSRWNRFPMCFRSNVISTSGFHFRCRGRHLSFRYRLMSVRVGSVISKSGMVDNVGVAVEIASPSVCVQTLFPP